jgi:hypothetical protein
MIRKRRKAEDHEINLEAELRDTKSELAIVKRKNLMYEEEKKVA